MEKMYKQKVPLLFDFDNRIQKWPLEILDDNLTLRNDRTREQLNQRDSAVQTFRPFFSSYHSIRKKVK
jgi:hypothetical protein